MTVQFERSLWFRILALVLALVLLVMAPVRAYATGLEAVVGVAAVEALKVIAPVLVALGVMVGIDQGVFDDIGVGAMSHLKDMGFVNDDGTINVTIADGKSYVPVDLLNAVRSWLFDAEVITAAPGSGCVVSPSFSVTGPYGTAYSPNTQCYFVGWYSVGASMTSFSYAFVPLDLSSSITGTSKDSSGKTKTMSVGSYDVTVDGINNSIWIPFSSTAYGNEYVTAALTQMLHNVTGLPCDGNASATLQYILSGSIDSIAGETTTTHDLTLGRVGTSGTTETEIETIVYINPAIREFANPNHTNPDDPENNKIRHYPVSITDVIDHTITQDEAQTGDTDIELETETDPEGGGSSGDGSGSDTGSGSGGAVVTPNYDHNQFALMDLRDFFPFCIPFDLYDFFSLLSADPVAPVLHWELQDLSGNVYSIDVDLSQWDSFAQTFRTLQLLVFCVGLAAGSRKFIKW